MHHQPKAGILSAAGLAILAGCAAPSPDGSGSAPHPTPDLPAIEDARDERWAFLRRTYDTDADGRITAAEYGRSERTFANLDRDRDGVIAAADFQTAGRRGPPNEGGAPAEPRQVARRLIDVYGSFVNRDGEPGISRAEWTDAMAQLELATDAPITAASFADLLGQDGKTPMARMVGMMFQSLDVDGDGSATAADWSAAFAAADADGNDVIESAEAPVTPAVGQVAPDFTLAHAADAEHTVTLSSYAESKPVALIFGSYT
ncbi:MAG: hypothetical protein AAF628_29755 [Planctomycetota bacterium]